MREDDELIEINDFSPGIFSDYHFSSTQTPSETSDGNMYAAMGAATIDGTFRCTADRTGSLVPLPKLVAGKRTNILPTTANAAANFLSGIRANFLMDAYVRGEMFVYGEQPAVDGKDRAGVYTMYGMPYEVGTEGTDFWTVIAQLHRLFDGATDQHDLMWAKCTASMAAFTTSTIQIGAGNFIPFSVRNSIEDARTSDCVAWVAFGAPGYAANAGAWKTGIMPAGDLAITTYDLFTNTTYPGSHRRVLGIFPDPKAATDTRSGFLGGTHLGPTDPTFSDCCHLVAHQGRMVGLTRTQKATGRNAVGSDTWGIISESVVYSPIQDFYGDLGFGCFETAQFGEEKPFRSGVTASITADEIIFIKDREGAVLVRGDLDNPTVVQMPYVESTHGVYSIPAKTNFGLVYGTLNGVYVWEGGESSRHISPQLDGFFWNHDTTLEYLGNRGRFAWWNPWVIVPNNFIFDSRTESWWRIDTPANTSVACSVADVSNRSNRAYLFPYKLDRDDSPQWWTADPHVLADTYSWRSQPLVQSRKRVITFHEIHLTVTPASAAMGSVTITLTGLDKNGVPVAPVATVFTLAANNNPQMLHKDIAVNFQATNVQVRIEANSNNASVAAPKVHSVSLAVANRARVAKG